MSITVNVKDIGLKELTALYYNDDGTIRKFKEVWSNENGVMRLLFKEKNTVPTELEWEKLNSSVTSLTTSNNGLSLTVKVNDNVDNNNPVLSSNEIYLPKGTTITMTVNQKAETSLYETYTYLYYSLYTDNGVNERQSAGVGISGYSPTSDTKTYTVPKDMTCHLLIYTYGYYNNVGRAITNDITLSFS